MLTSNQLSNNTATRDLPEYVPQSRLGRWWWLAGPLVALVALVLFALTRFGHFQGEDFTLLNQLRGNKRTIGDTLGFFVSDWGLEGKYYAPLPRLAFYLEYRFFTINAAGWHLFSAALHAIASALVWGLAWRLTRRPALALCAGLFFAVMPVHATVVSQPAAQADLWATIFCLGAAIAFVAARQQPEKARLYYFGALGLYFLALLCKQTALALPFALLAYDFITGGLDRILHQETLAELEADQQDPLNRFLLYHAPFFVLLLLYIALNTALLGGLGVFFPTGDQQTQLGEFLRGNLRSLAAPFGLGGTDGLILLAALGAFLALTGVQEWEAWRLNNPQKTAPEGEAPATPKKPARPRYLDPEDDEMDDLYVSPPTPEVAAMSEEQPVLAAISEAPTLLDSSSPAPPPAPPATPPEETPAAGKDPGAGHPSYWTLRTAGYGFLWTGLFLLPWILVVANNRTLYLPSVGFAIFLAAALAPFGASSVRMSNWKEARSLFGAFELSFWLRLGAIVAVVVIYFAASVNNIDEWNAASRIFAMLTAGF